jgi:hypothetical protein
VYRSFLHDRPPPSSHRIQPTQHFTVFAESAAVKREWLASLRLAVAAQQEVMRSWFGKGGAGPSMMNATAFSSGSIQGSSSGVAGAQAIPRSPSSAAAFVAAVQATSAAALPATSAATAASTSASSSNEGDARLDSAVLSLDPSAAVATGASAEAVPPTTSVSQCTSTVTSASTSPARDRPSNGSAHKTDISSIAASLHAAQNTAAGRAASQAAKANHTITVRSSGYGYGATAAAKATTTSSTTRGIGVAHSQPKSEAKCASKQSAPPPPPPPASRSRTLEMRRRSSVSDVLPATIGGWSGTGANGAAAASASSAVPTAVAAPSASKAAHSLSLLVGGGNGNELGPEQIVFATPRSSSESQPLGLTAAPVVIVAAKRHSAQFAASCAIFSIGATDKVAISAPSSISTAAVSGDAGKDSKRPSLTAASVGDTIVAAHGLVNAAVKSTKLPPPLPQKAARPLPVLKRAVSLQNVSSSVPIPPAVAEPAGSSLSLLASEVPEVAVKVIDTGSSEGESREVAETESKTLPTGLQRPRLSINTALLMAQNSVTLPNGCTYSIVHADDDDEDDVGAKSDQKSDDDEFDHIATREVSLSLHQATILRPEFAKRPPPPPPPFELRRIDGRLATVGAAIDEHGTASGSALTSAVDSSSAASGVRFAIDLSHSTVSVHECNADDSQQKSAAARRSNSLNRPRDQTVIGIRSKSLLPPPPPPRLPHLLPPRAGSLVVPPHCHAEPTTAVAAALSSADAEGAAPIPPSAEAVSRPLRWTGTTGGVQRFSYLHGASGALTAVMTASGRAVPASASALFALSSAAAADSGGMKSAAAGGFANGAGPLQQRSHGRSATKSMAAPAIPQWVAHTSDQCMLCRESFSLWRYRHSCKSCGMYEFDDCF